MRTTESILDALKQQGSRMTKIRCFVIDIFQDNRLPLAESEIREQLSKQGREANKTTVYRELEYLKSKGIVKEVDFGDGKKRYELDNDDHHHHLICTSCRKVDEVSFNDDLSHIERSISKNKKFRVLNHSLEFFGLCKDCNGAADNR